MKLPVRKVLDLVSGGLSVMIFLVFGGALHSHCLLVYLGPFSFFLRLVLSASSFTR